MQISLRSLLIIPLVLQVIGVTALVGYWSYRSGQQAVQDLIHQLIHETGNRVTDKLDSYLSTAHQINNSHIAAIQTGALRLDDLDLLHRYLIAQHRQRPNIKTIGLGQPNGTFLTSHRVNQEDFAANVSPLQLTDLPYEAGRSDRNDASQLNLYAIDDSGRLQRRVSTLENLDVRDRPWYQQAVTTQKPGWTQPFQLGRTNLLTLSAFTPFWDDQNQVLSVFFVNISLSQLNHFLATLPVGQTGEVFILERTGALIANSAGDPAYSTFEVSQQTDQELTIRSAPRKFSKNIQFRRLTAAESSNRLIRQGAQQVSRQLGSWSALEGPQVLPLILDGDRYFLDVLSYQDPHGLDWLIVIIIPESDFMTEIKANRQRTILLSLMAMLGAIACGMVITRYIVRPVVALSQATQQMAAGQPMPQTEPTTILEVDSLRQAFQQMVKRLDASFSALKSSEQRFISLLENVPVGISVFDPTGKVAWANARAKQLHGQHIPETEVAHLSETYQIYKVGTNQLYPVDQLPAIRALRGETVTVDDLEIVTPTGQRLPLEVQGSPIWNATGQIVYAIVAFQDISERRAAERLRISYEQELEREVAVKTAALEAAQRIAKMGSWDWHRATADLTLTTQLCQLLGWSSSHTSSSYRKILKMVHPEDRRGLHQAVAFALAQPIPFELECRVVRSDGTVRYCFGRGEPVLDGHQQVVSWMGTVTDITDRKQVELELRRLQAKLEIQATVDSLTQVANRHQLQERLDLEWHRCQHQSMPIALLMVDIDYFKAFNDRYGHLQGDVCLQQVAQILQSCAQRSDDLVARYGGEEFTLVLPQTDSVGALQVARNIQQAVQAAELPHVGSLVSDRVTLSIGIAAIGNAHQIQLEEALQLADTALYEAKQQRNCYCLKQA